MRQPVDPEKIAQLFQKYVRLRTQFDAGKLDGKIKNIMSALCRQAGFSIAIFYRKIQNRPRCYWVLQGIRSRCNNLKDQYYGGKGIKCYLTESQIAYLWKRDNADKMSNPSIDRINSDAHYTLENCRFLELSENSRRVRRRI